MISFDPILQLRLLSEALGPRIIEIEGNRATFLGDQVIDFSNRLDPQFFINANDVDEILFRDPDLLSRSYWLGCLLHEIGWEDAREHLPYTLDIRMCGSYHPNVSVVMDKLGSDAARDDFDAETIVDALSRFPAWVERVVNIDLWVMALDRIAENADDRAYAENLSIDASSTALCSLADLIGHSVLSLMRTDCEKVARLLSKDDDLSWDKLRLAGRLIQAEPAIGTLGYYVSSGNMWLDIFLTPAEVLQRYERCISNSYDALIDQGPEDCDAFIAWLKRFDPQWFDKVADTDFGAENFQAIYEMFESCAPDPSEQVAALLPFANLVMEVLQGTDKPRLDRFLWSETADVPEEYLQALKFYLWLMSGYLPTTEDNEFWENTRNILETKGFVAAASAWLYGLLSDGDLKVSDVSAHHIKRKDGQIISARIEDLDDVGRILDLFQAETVGPKVLRHSKDFLYDQVAIYVIAEASECAVPNVDIFVFKSPEGEDYEFLEGYSLVSEEAIEDDAGNLVATSFSRTRH